MRLESSNNQDCRATHELCEHSLSGSSSRHSWKIPDSKANFSAPDHISSCCFRSLSRGEPNRPVNARQKRRSSIEHGGFTGTALLRDVPRCETFFARTALLIGWPAKFSP